MRCALPYVPFLLAASAALGACSGTASNDNANSPLKSSSSPTPPIFRASAPPTPTPEISVDDALRETLAKADSSITYEHLKKNAEKYRGEPWACTGTIMQIQEDGGKTFALLTLGGWGDKLVAVRSTFTTDFVEKNRVYVIGHLAGDYSYQSVAGWDMTVPLIDAQAILKPSEESRLRGGKTPKRK
jgi:hypothetical protein